MVVMRQLITILFFLGYCITAYGQVSVSAKLETGQMTIGDQNILRLEAIYPENTIVQAVDLSPLDTIIALKGTENPDPQKEDFEILKLADWDTLRQGGKLLLRTEVHFTCWAAGAYPIPQIDFVFTEKGQSISKRTAPLQVMVSPPISEQENPDSVQLAPIKEIVAEPRRLEDFLPILIPLAILILLGLVAYFFYRRIYRKEATTFVTIKRPAHEVAQEKLAKLQAAELWQKGEIKTYQSELTYIVREYIEERFQFLALESTSGEILADLKKAELAEDLIEKLRKMFELADMVKFAKAQPPAESNQQLMDYAQEFVEATIPVPTVESDPKTDSDV